LPWGLAGAAVGGLVVALALRGGSTGGGGVADAPPRPIPLGGARAMDISAMTPRERANRLFDRVMRHVEAEQQDSVQFFLPMALQAHAMLLDPDSDARFHIGLLQLAAGDPAAAIAQADSIARQDPRHLFASMLRARALAARRDQPGAVRAYREFLRNERSERDAGRPEYADHDGTLDTFHAEAEQAVSR
jgi:tetratricopeptide (TPR) repeat protein